MHEKGLLPYARITLTLFNNLFGADRKIYVFLLLACQIHEDTYQQGSLVFNKLLELAVVSLAVPLYKQWSFLKKNFNKICSGVVCGTVPGIISVIGLAQIFHLTQQLLASLIPRSVTLPIALTLSNELGGYTSTTVFFEIFSGLVSFTIGPKLLKRLGIRSVRYAVSITGARPFSR
ncbi:hypothetical protein CVD25_18540 [Bacillus canaveralius]|uniref:Uncharacterized protein n=1 Tax=Bacillus canaveralius TaxID=1403243 RepID=A0A2N5GI60_9BACI|nr:LrgB family protein [Bacillus canaveralius]PLR80551.1 hypothetical protein CU635_17785 [Bacillus canaveralius]PLR92499.1 hypothetical protein CVD25_18540 [Bacillus canaveralius]